MARPIATRCRWPPESCEGRRSSKWFEVEDCGRLRDPVFDFRFAARSAILSEKPMFSRTVMCG